MRAPRRSSARAARLSIDLGEVRGFDYYTGTRFALYADGAGGALASGGRYDGLVARYGRPARAAGFALDVDRAAELLKLRGVPAPRQAGRRPRGRRAGGRPRAAGRRAARAAASARSSISTSRLRPTPTWPRRAAARDARSRAPSPGPRPESDGSTESGLLG